MGMHAQTAPEPNDQEIFIIVIFVVQGMNGPTITILAGRAWFKGKKVKNCSFSRERVIIVFFVYVEI